MILGITAGTKIHENAISLAQVDDTDYAMDLIQIQISDAVPNSLIEGNAQCSASEEARIQEAIDAVMPSIWQAVNNKDDDLWYKWFGDQPETDEFVQSVLYDAANWMSTRENFNVLCCSN